MNKLKIINDPVFGFLTVPNELIYDVLQHRYVQRLTRIRQLGVSYFVYPGATHTRFLHSIGAMHLMQEAIRSLRLKNINISESEATSAMIGILLHDIGHGPFSHVWEHTLVTGITHEDISLMLMEEISRDMGQRTSDVRLQIDDYTGPLDQTLAIFKDEYHKHFLHQLISSQLDVDRMDYLCRDAFFTGVQSGRVSSERIIKMLNVVDDHLVVDSKGIYSVEEFLIARRSMYWQVYLHKTSVAAELLLQKILSRAKMLASSGVRLFATPALEYFLYKDVKAEDFYVGSEALHQYTILDDNDVISAIKAWMTCEDKVLSLLSRALIERKLYHPEPLDKPLSVEDKSCLANDYALRFGISIQDAAEYFFIEHASTTNTYSEKDDSICIRNNDGSVRDIATASEILDMKLLLYKPKRAYLFKYRI